MAAMNWKRGAFPLWVVLTILVWVVLAIVGQDSLREAFKARADYHAYCDKHEMLIPTVAETLMSNSAKDYGPMAASEAAAKANTAPPSPFDTSLHKMSDYRRLYPEMRQRSNAEIVAQTYSDSGQPAPLPEPKPWRLIWVLVGIAPGFP